MNTVFCVADTNYISQKLIINVNDYMSYMRVMYC